MTGPTPSMRWQLALARWVRNRRRNARARLQRCRRLVLCISRTIVQNRDSDQCREALPCSLEAGRYCVVSTAHIRATTAALLDLWAGTLATAAPMTVASTVHGWFVATRPVRATQAEQVPDDLKRITQFSRAHGFDFVLLDCDASPLPDLQSFSW